MIPEQRFPELRRSHAVLLTLQHENLISQLKRRSIGNEAHCAVANTEPPHKNSVVISRLLT